ncbi:unnamed protein product [Rotaria sp. Silwood2]|nr:unnamed protein product [Rotaria sp. Silwood2]CAF2883790.1 unnamed protein product [Rotaria sp. Silwood2]CAF3035623.1 unnamed protein product [Rotaria sp. Silwood2]CAF3866690.1 unnamed protein product [Rotaria sp. Silwood2]CAF3948035.1 unnamed protein product [Rotaria sp. Silwood2]
MILSSIMHRTEPYLSLNCNDNQNVSNNKQTSTLSNLFSCSIHNCSCKRPKIGLVLYPKDIQIKNVILLVCDQCYHYTLENDTQHTQLEKWYFNIYKDSKSFQFKSRFSLNEDDSFHFYNPISNTNDLFNINERELENWEKEAVQQTVRKKLYNVLV